jgi:hypothetical protein
MRLLVMAVLALIAISCSSTPCFAQTPRDYVELFGSKLTFSEMQKRGGILVGTPTRDKKGIVFLPVEFDISGVRKITVQPTTMDSGYIVKRVDVRVSKNEIHLTVVKAYLTSRKTVSQRHSGPVRVGKIRAGEYQVFYVSSKKDKTKLADVAVPE